MVAPPFTLPQRRRRHGGPDGARRGNGECSGRDSPSAGWRGRCRAAFCVCVLPLRQRRFHSSNGEKVRMLMWLTFTGIIGCASQPLPNGGGDGGLTCASLPATVQMWLDSHQQCVVDDDCKWIVSGCGLPYQCGAPFNKAAQGAYLDGLIASWDKQRCVVDCPICPIGVSTVRCNSGTCTKD